jgi:hypothetical protein
MNNLQLLARLSQRATGPARVWIAVLVVLSCFQKWCQAQKEEAKAEIRFQIANSEAKLPPDFKAGPKTSPDSKLGLKPSGMTAQLYHTATGKPLGRPLKLTNRIYLGGEQNTEEEAQKAGKRITAWAFSPDGKMIAVGGSIGNKEDGKGEVLVWEVATRKRLASVDITKADLGYVKALSFSADGKTVIVHCEPLSGK